MELGISRSRRSSEHYEQEEAGHSRGETPPQTGTDAEWLPSSGHPRHAYQSGDNRGRAIVSGLIVRPSSTTQEIEPTHNKKPGGASHASARPPAKSGIEYPLAEHIRPQDDFYLYVNNYWLQNGEIPANQHWGAFFENEKNISEQVIALIEKMDSHPEINAPGSEPQKIRDLYASFMDEATIEKLGLSPLHEELNMIDGLSTKEDIPGLIAHFHRFNIESLFDLGVSEDDKEPSRRQVVWIEQYKLQLARSSYVRTDAAIKSFHERYISYIESVLKGSGSQDPRAEAETIFQLEVSLATAQRDNTALRDIEKNYNRFEIGELASLMPDFDWNGYFQKSGVAGKENYVIVGQPDYMEKLSQFLVDTSLSNLKVYFRWCALKSYSSCLPKAISEKRFSTAPQDPRKTRAIEFVNKHMGSVVGKYYVEQHFSHENQEHIKKMLGFIKEAFRDAIERSDWMTGVTKDEVTRKLDAMNEHIGYPKKWDDISGLTIFPDQLVGNLKRINDLNHQRRLEKIGRPVDWEAYTFSPHNIFGVGYDRKQNVIVFPAAFFHPPYFDANADDAVNYGASGVVLAHEISHAFDSEGRKYNAAGLLEDSWDPKDAEEFSRKTEALVRQASSYEILNGEKVNGKLTLRENVAETAGLAMAYAAYKRSLGEEEAPMIDGLTGDQRFFIGYAQMLRARVPEASLAGLVNSRHMPESMRTSLALKNFKPFHEAFDIKESDGMYFPEEERVTLYGR